MKKTLKIIAKTRTLLFIIAGVLVAGILLVSCGGGGYGGGGGGMYGGTSMGTVPGTFSLMSPSPISGAKVASLTPTLTWSTSVGATGYYVYLTGDIYSDTLIATVLQPTTMTTVMSPTTLISATTYTWQVKAYNAMGQTPASNGPGTFTTP